MKRLLLVSVMAVLGATSLPAVAFEGQVQQCFRQTYEEPQYSVTHHLVRAAYERVEYRGNHYAERVYYPAVYEERRSQIHPGRYVLRAVPCRH